MQFLSIVRACIRQHPRRAIIAFALLAGACGGVTLPGGNSATVTAPSNLTATVFSPTQINLAWTDNSSNEDGFRIERAPGGTTTFAEIATVGAGVTTYQNTGLSASTAYVYRVRAYNSSTTSDYSATATATTQLAAPTAPSNLLASAASSSQINLTWTDNSSNEDGFRVEQSTTGAGGFAEITTVGPGVTTYQNAGLTPSTSYTYRVRAYNAAGNSAYSNSAAGFTPANPGTPPTAPSGLTATAVASSQINLAWTDNSSDETGFHIERAPGGTTSFVEIGSVNAGVTAYQSTGLSASTQYVYRVRAYNAAGASAYTATATATTSSGPTPPAVPTNLEKVSISASEIDLTWNDNSSDEDGFRIERAPGGTTSFVEIGTVGPGVVIYWDTGLPASTSYSYRIRAYNAAGNSAYSNTANGSTAPNAPSALAATPVSSTQINLSWTDNSPDEIGFRIDRSTGGGAFTQVALVGPGVVTYQNTGLTASTSYTYHVYAYNTGGYSLASNDAIASTQAGATPPTAPSGLGATPVSSTQINLAWTDNSSDETGFSIERCQGGGCSSFAQIATVGAGVTTYPNTGLTASTSYSYRVLAYNGVGNSGYTATATASTLVAPPTAPSSLTATAASDVQINLSWTDNSSNETGFTIEQAPGGTTSFTVLATVGPGVTSVSNNSLPQGTTFNYRVKATNAGGSSGYSNTATATTWAVVYASAANAMQVQFVNGVQDATYSNTVYQSGKTGVGCNVVIGGTSVAACVETALQFSGFAAAVSGKTISSAYLRMSPSDLAGDFNAVYGAFLFSSSWSPSSITYNTEPGTYSSPSALHAPPTGAPIDFNVTAMVQAWVSGTANNGFLVTPTSTQSGSVVETTFFWSDDTYNGVPSYRPQLIIIFQ